MDGKLIIGTDIDTSGLEDGLVDIEQITKRIEEKIGRNITSAEKNSLEKELDGANETLKRFYDKLQEYYDAYAEAGSGGIIFKSDVERVAQLKQDLKEMIPIVEELTDDKIILPGINDTEKKIPKIDLGLGKIVKKIAQWGLALFGIRSAYSAIRSAMNTISQSDEQLKADIDYMKNALAYVLEPIVRKVVEWAKQLVFYIGYLIKAWTGHDIFASANKNLKKSVGSAKELRKQLAGFDEMNVLSDNSSGGAGGAMPSFNFEDMEVPKWLVKIKEIGEWVIDNWQDVVGVLLLTKLFIDILTGNWLGVVIDLLLLLIALFFKAKDAIKVIADNWKDAMQVIVDWFNKIIDKMENTKQKIVDKWVEIKEKIQNIVNKIKDWLTDKFGSIGTKIGEGIGGAIKRVINGVLATVENFLNGPIYAINGLISAVKVLPGLKNLKQISAFKFPRLAKGGIVNMPGRGVPVGSAIAGERGREAVLPLQDSQVLSEIADAIGSRININATVPVYVGNRMVAREIKRINAEDNFAYNR